MKSLPYLRHLRHLRMSLASMKQHKAVTGGDEKSHGFAALAMTWMSQSQGCLA